MAPFSRFGGGGGGSSPSFASGRGSPALKSAGAMVLSPQSSSPKAHQQGQGQQGPAATTSSAGVAAYGKQSKLGSSYVPGGPPSRLGTGQKTRTATHGQHGRRPVNTIEMLQYIKGLGIDPIHESELLWIAEEAFSAHLPPSWGEHQDERGRVYFHNSATGLSSWQHPLDELYREVVDYQRRVMALGGFWELDRELEDFEARTQAELSQWTELYDEHGQKFFFNASSKASRFDDPRQAGSHALSARLRCVARMKEKLPLLAAALQPSDADAHELVRRRSQEREQDMYLGLVVRLQSAVRVMLARRRVCNLRARTRLTHGVQPLRGRIRLRMEKVTPGGSRELVLGITTPHKRNKAATKIQARCRGILVRKRLKPLLEHEAFKHRCAVVLQKHARRWLAKRRVQRLKAQRLEDGATALQRLWKGHLDRRYVSSVRSERSRYQWMLQCVVRLQCGVRCALARREARRRRKGIFR